MRSSLQHYGSNSRTQPDLELAEPSPRVPAVSNLPAVIGAPALVVQQHKEMLEVFIDIETRNRYTIQLPGGQLALYAAETGEGVGAFLTRSFLKSNRPFTMRVTDPHGNLQLTLRRPWNWFFSELHVEDANGQPIGMIDQQFAWFSRRFAVLDPAGNELAQLHGPMLRPWTFRIMVGGHEVGKISKKWSGLLKEAFTDADSFGLEMGPSMSPTLRTLAMAATFLIDFLYFEDSE